MKEVIKKDIVKLGNMLIEDSNLYNTNLVHMNNISANLVNGVLNNTVTITRNEVVYDGILPENVTSDMHIKTINSANMKTEYMIVNCMPAKTEKENDKLISKIEFNSSIDLSNKVIHFIYFIDSQDVFNSTFFKLTNSYISTDKIVSTIPSTTQILILFSTIDSTKSYIKDFEKVETLYIKTDGTYKLNSIFKLEYRKESDDYIDALGNINKISTFKTTQTSTKSYAWKSFKTRPYISSSLPSMSSSSGSYTEIKYPETTFPSTSLTLPSPTEASLYDEGMGRIFTKVVNNTELFVANMYVNKYSIINGVESYSFLTDVSLDHSFIYQTFKFDIVPHISLTPNTGNVTSSTINGLNIKLADGDVFIDANNFIKLNIIDDDSNITIKKGEITTSFDGTTAYTLDNTKIQFYRNNALVDNTSTSTLYNAFDSNYTKLKTALSKMFTDNKLKFVNSASKLSDVNAGIYAELFNELTITFTLLGKTVTKKYTIPAYLPRILEIANG